MTWYRSLAGAGALSLAALASPQTHPWAMSHADAQRTQQSFSTGALLGELNWKYRIAGRIPQFATHSNGDIVLGVTFMDNWWNSEEFLTVLRPDGVPRARRKMEPYPWGYAQGSAGAPAIAPDGHLVIASAKSQLHKIDPTTAETLWQIDGHDGSPNYYPVAMLPDGTIYWEQFLSIRKITPAGQVTQTYGGGGATFCVAPNGDVFVEHSRATEPHTFIARRYFNADGTLRWSQSALKGGTGRMFAIGPEGDIYSGSYRLRAADGSTVWSDTSMGPVGVAIGKNAQVYGYGDVVRAYNKDTGAILWTTDIPGSALRGAAIDSRDVLYFTTTTGDVVAMTQGGTILWQRNVCDSFRTGPVIGPDNTIIAQGTIGFSEFVFSIK